MIGQENLNLFQVQKWSFAEGNAPGAELDLVYHNSPPVIPAPSQNQNYAPR